MRRRHKRLLPHPAGGRSRIPTRQWAAQFVASAAATVMVVGAAGMGAGDVEGPSRISLAASASPIEGLPPVPTGSLDEAHAAVERARQDVDDLVARAMGRTPQRQGANRSTDCAVENCVALTFDDGPRRHTTGPLLDLLAARGETATFFVVGRAIAGNEDLLVRMRDLGMEVENHTWNHPRLSQMAGPGVTDELRRTSQAITRATGVEPTFMRPPYGDWTPGVTPTAGLVPMLWDVDSLDWRHRDSREVTRRVLDQVRPGAVILLHDIHPTTVGAVPGILDGLEQRGLTVATLRDLRAGTKARGGTDLAVTAY